MLKTEIVLCKDSMYYLKHNFFPQPMPALIASAWKRKEKKSNWGNWMRCEACKNVVQCRKAFKNSLHNICMYIAELQSFLFAYGISGKCHSSEKRCLCLMKSSSKRIWNLPYLNIWNSKIAFSVFHFVLLYFCPNECPGLCWHRPGHSLGKK